MRPTRIQSISPFEFMPSIIQQRIALHRGDVHEQFSRLIPPDERETQLYLHASSLGDLHRPTPNFESYGKSFHFAAIQTPNLIPLYMPRDCRKTIPLTRPNDYVFTKDCV
jgi:hypothetical protein